MHSVGEKIRSERQRQNRSLSAIAGDTCISSRYLQAIEGDDLATLPGFFFYKSFVKQYTAALGMDYKTIEADVERMVPADEIDPLPVLVASYQIAKTEGRITRFPRNKIWSAGLLLVTLAAGSGFYYWWQKSQRGPGDLPAASVQVAQATIIPATEVPAAPLRATEPVPAAVESALATSVSDQELPKPQAAAKPEPGKLSIGVSAIEKTWVSLSSDGKTIFSGVLDASQSKNIEGIENAKLLTGNAAGLDVRWNGKPIGPLGSHGQVKVVVFTLENFQILSPRKM